MARATQPRPSATAFNEALWRHDEAAMCAIEREARADGATSPDLTAVSARWERVRDAILKTVRARIARRAEFE